MFRVWVNTTKRRGWVGQVGRDDRSLRVTPTWLGHGKQTSVFQRSLAQATSDVIVLLFGSELAIASPLLFEQCFALSLKLGVDRRTPFGADISL